MKMTRDEGRIFGLGMLWGAFLAVASGLSAYFITTAILDQSPQSTPIRPFTAFEMAFSPAVRKVPPITILLRFDPQDVFDKEKSIPESYAYTEYWRQPCTIVTAAGKAIAAYPARGIAMWENSEDSEAIAHEILHCIAGAWHPDWAEIEQTNSHAVIVPIPPK